MKTNKSINGGPAFPVCFDHNESLSEHPVMSLRDYFAAKALCGIMAGDGLPDDNVSRAELAYEMADAMLKMRLK